VSRVLQSHGNEPMSPSSRQFKLISLAALLLVAGAGCEEETRQTSRPKIKTREVLGKTTQEIRPAAPELQQGGAREAVLKVTSKDPITISGNAYVVAIGKIAVGQIQHALDLYQAEHGDFPKTYDQFMNEIIKPNGIRLPQLPYYQEYGYDEKEHRLLVLEYPLKKAEFQDQQDRELGRR
jgi:hypothetical protein